jgi:hypothetical protein
MVMGAVPIFASFRRFVMSEIFPVDSVAAQGESVVAVAQ